LELVVVMVVVSCGSALEREKDAKRFLWMVDVWPLREIKTKKCSSLALFNNACVAQHSSMSSAARFAWYLVIFEL
jgi:hypothetical protein